MISRTLTLLTLTAGLAVPALAGPQQAELDARVRQFVSRQYIHGIPYDEAHALGAEALPVLQDMLADDAQKPRWDRIVNTIAYVGAPRGRAILHHFVWTRFQGEVDLDTFQALVAAQHFLGHIRATADSPLLAELEAGVDPAHWDRLPWQFRHYTGERLSVLFSKLTINALSFTGSPRAVERLQALSANPFSALQISNIEEGLERLATIARIGLAAYETRRLSARNS